MESTHEIPNYQEALIRIIPDDKTISIYPYLDYFYFIWDYFANSKSCMFLTNKF